MMTGDEIRFRELLEQRTTLLQSLSSALRASGAAVVSCDITDFEMLLAEQQALCSQITALDAQTRALRLKFGALRDPRQTQETRERDERLADALERSRLVAESVKHENERQQSLVRRSKRTVAALLNSFRTFEGDYESLVGLASSQASGPAGGM